MKRIVWLTLLAIGLGTTAAGAGSGPLWLRSSTKSPGAQAAPTTEYRTHCVCWADAKSNSLDTRPLVWVLDGAGDLKGCSTDITAANAMAGSPVELNIFPWSHGYRKLLRDQTDTNHAKLQGARLAEAILARKAAEPHRRIIVAAHSAGCAVALAAGDVLPMDAVDRFLLLSPSVSTGYDLRPTLWSAKEGVDVFCSKKDWVALGIAMKMVGTTDNFWSGSAAGRWGFKPKGSTALANLEVSRLRQHFWTQDVAWTGNTGGHHGSHAPEFVRNCLMPLMLGN